MKAQIKIVQSIIDNTNAKAALLTFLPDIRWACGFTGSNGLLLVMDGQAHFVSDGRYEAQAHQEVKGATVHIPGYNLFEYVAEEGLLDGQSPVVFQADHVTVNQLDTLKDHFPDVTWRGIESLITEHVAAKSAAEIECIQKAQSITDEVFDYICDFIEPGITERELAAEIVYQHLRRGAEKMSFDPIVASGPNSAFPHARPTDRTLQPNEPVLVDMGCFRDGYASDMTRTVFLGDPTETFRAVYATVLEAQQEAIAAARAGMTGKELDAVARDVIEEAGYGDQFSHGLGHGIGLQIHEWPKLSYHVEHDLPEGATVTIEPGIYLEGKFGVRIEDIVALNATGNRRLTTADKTLIVV